MRFRQQDSRIFSSFRYSVAVIISSSSHCRHFTVLPNDPVDLEIADSTKSEMKPKDMTSPTKALDKYIEMV